MQKDTILFFTSIEVFVGTQFQYPPQPTNQPNHAHKTMFVIFSQNKETFKISLTQFFF